MIYRCTVCVIRCWSLSLCMNELDNSAQKCDFLRMYYKWHVWSYVAQHPVCQTAQRTIHFTPWDTCSLRHKFAKHPRELLNIFITQNIDCFPKCCEVVTTLRERPGQVKGLWFDTHIVIMTIFSQPQCKPWLRFLPQSFICHLVSPRSMVRVVWFYIQRDIGGVGCIHTCLSS